MEEERYVGPYNTAIMGSKHRSESGYGPVTRKKARSAIPEGTYLYTCCLHFTVINTEATDIDRSKQGGKHALCGGIF